MKLACDKCLKVQDADRLKDWLRVSIENTVFNLCPVCAGGIWMAVDSELPPIVDAAPKDKHTDKDEVPKDCQRCWCEYCANLEGCVVEKDGYAPEQKPCPCDGCKKGQRYMPMENKPTCGRYIEEQNNG